MAILYPPWYPEISLVEYHDQDLHWPQIQNANENGFHISMAPRQYKIIDFQDRVPQFQAIVTQKNQISDPHGPFSTVTIYSCERLETIDTKILSFPDIRRMVFLPPSHFHQDNFGEVIGPVIIMLQHFDTLQSLVIPIEFIGSTPILLALEDHPKLIQLELISPTFRTTSHDRAMLEFGLTSMFGLSKLQNRLQKLILPASFLSPDVLRYLGNMEHLKHLKIQSMGGSVGGNHFVDMISEYGISSEHAFHALRILDVGVGHIHPSKLCILWNRFPDIQYL